MRRTERERLARKREYKRFAALRWLSAEEVRNFPGGLRKVMGWCPEVERLNWSNYEIIELPAVTGHEEQHARISA